MKTLLLSVLIFSLSGLHAQELGGSICPVQTTTLRISQPAPDIIRFEVCTNGRCRPLGNKPGYYRLSDMQARRGVLRGRLRSNNLNAKIRESFVQTGSVTFGLLGVTFVSMCATGLFPAYRDVLLNSTIGLLTLSSFLGALMPYATHLWQIHEAYKEQDQTLGAAVRSERRPMSEAQLIKFINQLDHALTMIPSLSECEVGLLPTPTPNSPQ